MKKMKRKNVLLIIVIMLVFILPSVIYAAGSIRPSTNSLSITKGSSKTFTITASNACGRVDISSSDSGVAKVNVSNKWLENDSVTVTVTAVSAGNANIIVRLTDAATFDEEELTGSYTVKVTVSAPQTITPPTIDNSKPSENQKPNTDNNTKPSTNNKVEENNKSKNNNLKNLSVEGFDLNNLGNDVYELDVDNTVSKIKIKGEVEDNKATLVGVGEKEVQIGKNTFIVTVTSESGAKRNYTINVNRKDGFYIEDLAGLLFNEAKEKKDVILKKDDKITVDNLNVIKESKKIVEFNKYNDEKKLLYSWIFDGSQIDEAFEINTNLNFISEYINEIGTASNYAEGLYLNFEHNGKLPNGTKVKVYVGDKFTDGNIVNVYYYNQETSNLEAIQKDLIVTEGYVEFSIEHCSDYFVTMSDVLEVVEATDDINIFLIISIVELIIILMLTIGILVIKLKK